jgi:hypothetical protein
MISKITKYNKIILVLFILILVVILVVIVILIYNSRSESFKGSSANTSINANLFNDSRYEKNRTQLYGSLFLDKLNEQIKGLTDPQIQYDTKRIDIIKYADVLL